MERCFKIAHHKIRNIYNLSKRKIYVEPRAYPKPILYRETTMLSILIVDNNITEQNKTREIIAKILLGIQHPPVTLNTAGTVKEAIEFLKTTDSIPTITLLITTYDFPRAGPNGLDLIHYVSDQLEMKKVLVVESSPSVHQRVIAAEEGADVIIQKPLTTEKLKEIILDVMNQAKGK